MGILDAPAADWRGKPLAVLHPARDIPSALAWFDASTLTGSNGQALTQWAASFGGFSMNLTPATNKPTLLTAAANGLNAVRFAPTSYFRNTDTFGAGGQGLISGWAQPLSFAFVFRMSTDYAVTGNVSPIGSSSMNISIAQNGLSLYGNAGTAGNTQSPQVNDGQWHVAVFNFGTGGANLYLDGYIASVTATNLGAGTLTNLFFGTGLGLAPTAGTLDLAEVIIAQSVLTLSRVDDLTRKLATKWGIS
jgi:hypothetical protein